MNKCKKILLTGHTQKKEYLHKLYTDRQIYISSLSSSEQPIEEEKRFWYRDISFQFEGTGYRSMENLVLYIYVPEERLAFNQEMNFCAAAYEDFLLRSISKSVNSLADGYQNDHKSKREKPQFSMQPVNSTVQRRNGCLYRRQERAFRLRVHFTVPLINGVNINGKAAYKALRSILEIVENKMDALDSEKLENHVQLYLHQQEIREYLQKNGLVAFVRNGSVLPRQGETDVLMEGAVPFISPIEMERELVLRDGTRLIGMEIGKGITVITGGGYSGKSTLLDALEMGIYNHIEGDGREYVISDRSACKIYAEDGRYIKETDISPFFQDMPGDTTVSCFSTKRASGSVSQAAGIIEAVYGGCRLLLIDEDTSATNFMIRDAAMRLLVEREPIIPFTDRVRELSDRGISTVLVIGGSGEYLKYADEVILLEDYTAKCKTEFVKTQFLSCAENKPEREPCRLTEKRYIKVGENSSRDFYYSECVKIEDMRFVRINQYMSDISRLTAIISDEQIYSLTCLLEKIIGTSDDGEDLFKQCRNLVEGLFEDTAGTILSNAQQYEFWLEQIRAVDLLMAICRMRQDEVG